MTTEVLTGREDQDVREVISVMRTRDIRTLPVLNERGELSGIFTLGGPWKRGEGPRSSPSLARLPKADPPPRSGRRKSS
jgi:CBS-domain-containing membrane protein